MPCNYKEYPKNWKWISRQIISDAGNRCELCYAPNGKLIIRWKKDTYPWRLYNPGSDAEGEVKVTKVVLTVHHIDSDKSNSDKLNLISLCQRCHLRLDLQKHIFRRKQRGKQLPSLFDEKNEIK